MKNWCPTFSVEFNIEYFACIGYVLNTTKEEKLKVPYRPTLVTLRLMISEAYAYPRHMTNIRNISTIGVYSQIHYENNLKKR